MPGTVAITSLIFAAVFSSVSRSLPNSLTEFSPFTPDAASSTLSSMFWEKLKSTPGKRFSSAWSIWSVSLSLSMPRRPFAEGLEWHVEFGVEETGRIRAVVGPSVLRDDRDGLRVALDYAAHLVDIFVRFLQRHGGRHRGADPEISLFEMRQEFHPERPGHQHGGAEQQQHAAERDNPVDEREFDNGAGHAAQEAHHEGLGLFELLGKEQCAEGRRDRECRQQAARDRIGIGPRHGTENVAFDA